MKLKPQSVPIKSGSDKNKTYSITFNSKGEYFFEEVTGAEGIEIIIPKDKWEYEESTGIWYEK